MISTAQLNAEIERLQRSVEEQALELNSKNRELEIEAALERVRATSIAMHKSEELVQVVRILDKEILGLGIEVDGTQIITDFANEEDGINIWYAKDGADFLGKFHIPYINHFIQEKLSIEIQKGTGFYTETYSKSDKDEYFKLLFKSSDFKSTPKKKQDYIYSRPSWVMAYAISKNSILLFERYNSTEFSKEEEEIFTRIEKVFEQAYIRFLDLKKAEEQAREAQIEAVLEKIRSRSLAMQSQDELADIINLVLSKLQELGIENGGEAGIIISKRGSKTATAWLASPDLNFPVLKFFYPISPKGDFAIEKLFFDAQENRIEFAAQSFTFEEKNNYWEWAFKNSDWKLLPEERKTWMLEQVSFDLACAVMENSALYLPTFTGQILSDEQGKVLVRFARVFEQAYVRFLDLQKAEAQAREAVKQSSLDRVRAEIASMRDAKDLERITPLVWSELKSLGVPFFRCGVMIANEAEEILDFYLSNPEGEALAALHLDYANSEITRKGVDHWRKKETYIEHWDQEQFLAFMKSLMDQGQISNQARYQGGENPPTALTLQFVPFTQGMVYVGSESDLSEEELDLVKALGKSLSVAYARYEDFTKLDLAKAKAEKALNDLKAAQEQLVQQEKLASLGQLSAGIAHEIKNPLNFVNNFSDLSRELIDEVFLELGNIEDSDTKEQITAILNDVKSNLTKVHEHGSRADSIVTSMLQHSRASGSKREAKAFNPLVKEFVNLSYHGMRAGKAPINVDIDLHLDPKVGEVTLISEDFSRVILNLCNNAFDAMREKLKADNSNGYLAKLTVKTALLKDKVIFSIADNGPGIPADIKDKILQPFFTTKKGTEGTGLGLSITNDIIKAHGAGLKVESTLGKGSEFIIQLPLV